jgi:hypothetical protein
MGSLRPRILQLVLHLRFGGHFKHTFRPAHTVALLCQQTSIRFWWQLLAVVGLVAITPVPLVIARQAAVVVGLQAAL